MDQNEVSGKTLSLMQSCIIMVKRFFMNNMLESKVSELEEKVRVLARAMNLMLMEGEEMSREEIEEVKRRLNDWLKEKRSKFISLKEALQSDSP